MALHFQGRILHIETAAFSNLNNTQIGWLTSNDADLGVRSFGGKDGLGNERVFLFKNLPVKGTTATFTAMSTAGFVKNDSSGVLSGGNAVLASGVEDGTFTQGSVLFVGSSLIAEDNANFFWDDANDRLSLGAASASTQFHMQSATTASPVLTIENDTEDATGPTINMLMDRPTTPADNDALGSIDFSGDDSGGTETVFARIQGQAQDVTDTTEDGTIKFSSQVAGSLAEQASIEPNGMALPVTKRITFGASDKYITSTSDALELYSAYVNCIATDNVRLTATKTINIEADAGSAGGSLRINLKIGTTTRFRVENDGDISMGVVTTNAAALHLTKATTASVLIENTGDAVTTLTLDADRGSTSDSIGQIDFDWNGTPVARISGIAGDDTTNKDEGDLRFHTANAGSSPVNRMTITQEGFIGFGPFQPTKAFQMQQATTAEVLVENTGDAAVIFTLDSDRASAGDSIAEFDFDWDATTIARIQAIAGDDDTNDDEGDLAFSTAAGGSLGERMRITQEGNVGIGVTPTNLFQIQSATAAAVLIENTGDASTNVTLDADRASAGDTIGVLDFDWNGAPMARIQATAGDDDTNKDEGDLSFATTAAGSLTEHMRIVQEGDVLIGTTATPSANNGKVLVFGDNTADPTMGTNTAGLYGKNVTTTVEMFAVDEGGAAAQLTPHNFSLFAPADRFAWDYYYYNRYTGDEVNADIYGAIREIEAISGKKFIYTKKIPVNDRLDWDTEQSKRVAESTVKVDVYEALSAEKQAERTAPVQYVAKVKPVYFE